MRKRLARLFGEGDEAGQAALARQPGRDTQEPLLPVEGLIALELPERFGALGARGEPALRDGGHVLRRVLDRERSQARSAQQPIVLTQGDEEEVADRRAERDLVVAQRPG